MSVVVVPMTPMYVKKADAKDFLSKTHRGVVFVAIIYSCLVVGMKWLLSTSMQSRGLVISNPLTDFIAWGYVLLTLFTAGKLFFEEPDYVSMNKRIGSYKSEQMVKTELVLGNYYKKLILVLFVGVMISVVAIIWPIYSAISSIGY